MTLNEIFRRSGEPTYYTPMAVVGQLVNQNGGQVTIINPPFRSQPRARCRLSQAASCRQLPSVGYKRARRIGCILAAIRSRCLAYIRTS